MIIYSEEFYKGLVAGFLKELSDFYSQGESKSAGDVGYNIDKLKEIFEDLFIKNRKKDELVEKILDRALDSAVAEGGITREGKYKSIAIKKNILKDHFLEFFKSFSKEVEAGEGKVIDLTEWIAKNKK